MGRSRKYDYAQVLKLRLQGLTVRDIGHEMDMSIGNVNYALNAECKRRRAMLVRVRRYELRPTLALRGEGEAEGEQRA